MTDLRVLIPELMLTAMALALIVVARHVTRGRVAAAAVIVTAIAAAVSGWAFTPGGVATGFGGTVVVDSYARFFFVLFAANLALAALLSVRLVEAEHVAAAEYYALLLFASTGMMLSASAIELLVLYLGLELMTLCSYILVGIRRDRLVSNEAAIKYFLLGSFASALLLYGIALVYGVTGVTHFAGIADAVSARGLGQDPILLAGVSLVVCGLAFKIAAVPFHAWAPDVYQGATAPVAAFLAAGSKAAGLAALLRLSLTAFSSDQRLMSDILIGLAALSVVVGSLLAVAQSNMKRLLAYSSIAHVGYALLGLVAGTPDGAAATMTYAFVYAFMTLGAFGIVIALGERGEELDAYRGLAATAPVTAALMFTFLLSLTGIPLTAGFTAKFGVILSAVRAGYVALAVLVVVCTVISAFYYLRVAVLMYMTAPQVDLEPERSAPGRLPAAVGAALAVAALVTILGGIAPETFAAWTVPPQPAGHASRADMREAPAPAGDFHE